MSDQERRERRAAKLAAAYDRALEHVRGGVQEFDAKLIPRGASERQQVTQRASFLAGAQWGLAAFSRVISEDLRFDAGETVYADMQLLARAVHDVGLLTVDEMEAEIRAAAEAEGGGDAGETSH